jgi:outer membrane protein assembly factor BamD (BamD/ComL family)
MTYYYYILSIMLLTLIFLLIRSVILRRKNAPVRLYHEALKNENSGDFEEAVVTYEKALEEIKKIRFHSTLKNKIAEKIKVLHTLLEYKNNLWFTRSDF